MIGIIGAMDEEVAKIVEAMESERQERKESYVYIRSQ